MVIAQDAFNSLYKLWEDRRLPLSMKLRMYFTAVCSTFTHACESWDLTEEVRKTINGFNRQVSSCDYGEKLQRDSDATRL